MNSLSVFYYPYATLSVEQTALFQASILYFDNLYMLDPYGVRWDLLHFDDEASDLIYEAEHFIKRVDPSDVLSKYE